MATGKRERWQGDDSILFHKRQVRIGTVIINHGRIDHGARFTVTNIVTFEKSPSGQWRPKRVKEVVHLDDQLTLVKTGSNETRQGSFANFSYSSIWRLHRG